MEKLRQSYPYVDLVFGVDGIDRLPAMLAERIRRGKRVSARPGGAQRGGGGNAHPPGFRLPCLAAHHVRLRQLLHLLHCALCARAGAQPGTRRPFWRSSRSLVAAGYKEITLLGQNVNSYGKGLAEPIDFADLLNLLCTTCPATTRSAS